MAFFLPPMQDIRPWNRPQARVSCAAINRLVVGARFIAPVVHFLALLHLSQKPAYFVHSHYRLKVETRFIAPVVPHIPLLLQKQKPAYFVHSHYRLEVEARFIAPDVPFLPVLLQVYNPAYFVKDHNCRTAGACLWDTLLAAKLICGKGIR